MESKDKTREQEEQNRSKMLMEKKGDFEASQKLTQRLYACYSESQILIPNELLTSVRNTIEDIDRREEIKRRNKERKTKLAATMRTALQDSISSPNYASMANLPANLTVTDIRDLSATGAGLPPLSRLSVPQYAATTKAKERPVVLKPVDIRAKGERELTKQRSPQHGKPMREKGRLKPLKKPKYKRTGKKDDISSHIEIIRYIEDSKGEELSCYYYCLRGRQFYEFFECNYEDITKESDDYITISARGITHFVSKEAEFLTLTEWKDEVENYQKINQVSFFKNFRIGKSFTLWKRLVKRTKMIEHGSYLGKELFQADGQINRQLIKLRQLINNLQKRDIIQLKQDQPQGLEKQSTNIREDQDKLKSQLRDMENGIKDLIFMACEGKIVEFNQNTRIFGKEETKNTDNKEDLPYHIFADDTYHPMPYTVEASINTLYKRLARFIRMVDYMLMQLKISIIRNSYDTLLSALNQRKTDGTKTIIPLLKVAARFAGDELAFSPTVAEVKEMLSLRLSDGIRMICTRPMLADEAKFKDYMAALKDEGDKEEEGRINPLKMVEESEDIKTKKKDIEDVLDVAFRQLENYQKDLLPFIAVHKKHCELDFSRLEGQQDTMYRIWVEQFEKDRNLVSDKLEETKVLGIISVDASEMKRTIVKKPKDSRDNMEKIIPTHSSIIIRNLMEKMKIIEEGILSITTWNIDEYVKYRKFLEEHRRNSDTYDEQLSKAKCLHAIMSEFQMRLSNKGKKELETLESKWKNVKEKLKVSFEKCEAVENQQKAALTAKGQEMNNRLKTLIVELDADKFYKKTEAPVTIVEDLAGIETRIQNAEEECKKIQENQLYLQTPKDEFDEKARLKNKHEHLKKFWNDQAFWHEKKAEWCQAQIKMVETEVLSKKVFEMREVAKNAEQVLKVELERDFTLAKEFQDEELDPMLSAIDVIKNVLKDTVQEWHWKTIMEMLACKVKRDDPELNLKTLMTLIKDAKKKWKEDNKSEAKIEEWIAGIVDQAMHEYQLSKEYEKIKQKWDALHPTTRQAPGSKLFLEEPERLQEVINDCMSSLQKILGNEYAAPLRDKAEDLYKKISKFEEILEELLIVEKKIKLVDELLSKEEFKTQNFGTKCEEVQKLWKRYLTLKRQGNSESGKDTLIQKFLSSEEHYLALYQDLGKRVDDIINDIELKAEEKQIDCPRLLFLSNKEFIRILCDWKKLEVMTVCMQKCFGSIKKVLTSTEGEDTYLTGVVSNEGEEFLGNARAKVRIGDSIDNAIKAVEGMFREGLKSRIRTFVSEYATEAKTRVELIAANLYQAAMVGEGLIFTSNTEIVLDEDEGYEDNMALYFQEQCTAYMDAGKLLTQSLLPAAPAGEGLSRAGSMLPHGSVMIPARTVINDAKRMGLSALIVQYVHYRDVVDFLSRNDVHGVNNFYWQMQLRFYQPDSTIVKQLDTVFEYGYEYLGVRNPSPITPTVERCWLSYTTALRNRYWSTVVGPPDHGKCSTIQDLASALGKFCYQYVCTPDTTAKTIEKLLIAAVSASSWLVIENANTLQLGALSSLAHQLYTLKQALHEDNKGEWHPASSKPIPVVPKTAAQGSYAPYFGIFLLVDNTITNKAKVPHMIKSMFRPVAVTKLELGPAAESWLYSFGFKEGNTLGYKLESFFRTAQDLMAAEGFTCDFGLRTLNSLVRIAAALKSEQPDSKVESRLVLAAIKSLFGSRLAEPALTTIEKIARMVFSEGETKEITPKTAEIPVLVLQQACKNLALSFDTDITPKLNELHNAFAKHVGCVLVGEAVCGKTKLLELLSECYKIMYEAEGEKCEIVTLFHKGFTQAELYGAYDSRIWVEGILAENLLRLARKGNKKCCSFIHCDGPLDPGWVEQLQTSFEEQRRVTLGNGDFILLGDYTKVVFEAENLRQASPGTVSRTAVIYLQKDTVMPRNIIDNWVKKLEGKLRSFEMVKGPLELQINALLYNGLASRALIPKLKEEKIILSDNTITLTFCSLFEAIYTMLEPSAEEKKDKAEEKIKKLVGKAVVFAVAWAFGGSLSHPKLKKIDEFIEEAATLGDKPKEASCFDAYLRNRDGPAEFSAWTELFPPFRNLEPDARGEESGLFKYSAGKTFTQMVVPTKQLIRYKWFIETLAGDNKNVLLFGDSGSGKSLISSYSLIQKEDMEVQPATIPAEDPAIGAEGVKVKSAANGPKFKKVNLCFTWNTTSAGLQTSLEERLDKKRRNLYSAPTLRKAVVYIDDVNLPQADRFGSVPVLECLRGIMEQNGYYDRSRHFWKRISKSSFLCTASPAYGGRKEMSERFLRHFSVFYMNTVAYQDRRSLFETVIFAHLFDFAREYNVAKSGFLETILDIHDIISQKLPGNPHNPHYLLSFKDAGKVLSGILLLKKEAAIPPEVYGRMVIHEAIRVYRDRYTSVADKELFNHEVEKVIEKQMNAKWKLDLEKDLMFTTLRAPEAGQYAEVKDWNEIRALLDEKQEQYNTEQKLVDPARMSLVFFKEAVEYILKVARILAIPRSHMINLGPQALGRRSLMEITTYLYNNDLITMDHNMRDFSANLKHHYANVKASLDEVLAGRSKGVVLMAKVGESHDETKEGRKARVWEEYEQNTDTILDGLYQVLSTGDLKHVGEDVKCNDIRDYLHIVLSMPNSIPDIRRKMRMYPGFFTECYLVYQDQWPTAAAVSIAAAQLAKSPEDIKGTVPDIIVKMHAVVEDEVRRAWMEEGRKIVVVPSQGKEIAKTFLTLYEQKEQALANSKAEVLKGIENVEQARTVEKQCQDENSLKKPDSEKKKQETDEAFAKCKELETEINAKRVAITEEEGKEKTGKKKVPAEKETETLEKAKQELSSARTGIKSLNWKEFSTMADPSPVLVALVEAAWILTSDKHGQWDLMQKNMNKRKSDALLALDLSALNDLDVYEAKVLFEEAKAALELLPSKLSAPGKSLYEWELAAFGVLDETKSILATGSALEKKKEDLYDTMIRLSKMRKRYEALKSDRDKFTRYRNSLEAKCSLLNELYQLVAQESPEWKGVKVWEKRRDAITEKQQRLMSDMLISAGILTYFGPFSWRSRERIRAGWVKIFKEWSLKVQDNPLISKILGETPQLAEYHQKSLLHNETCVENALIMAQSPRWPLIIDPEGAAGRWLGTGRKKIKDSSLHIHDEMAKEMAAGTEVLLDVVKESIDRDILQLLELPRKRQPSSIPKEKYKYADKQVDLHDNFTAYLRTDHSNPVFADDICSVANIINFSLPPEALQDLFTIEYSFVAGSSDFADLVLQKENPLKKELRERKAQMLSQMNQIVLTRIDEEDQRALKEKMHDTMKNVVDLKRRMLEAAADTSKENGEKLVAIRPLVVRAGLFYKCVSNLTSMNQTYLFTYDFVKEQYYAAIRAVPELTSFQSQQQSSVAQLKEALLKLTGNMTQRMVGSLERAMFHTDFLLFVFYFAVNIAIEGGDVTGEEWMVFLYGDEYIQAKTAVNKVKNPMPARISEKAWNLLAYLETTVSGIYAGASQDIQIHYPEWELWISGKSPHLNAIPGDLQKKLVKPIQRLTLMRLICPEKLLEAQEWFSTSVLGDFYLQLKHPTLLDLFTKETKINKPLLIIKDEGEDPTAQVSKLGGEEPRVSMYTLNIETEAEIRRVITECSKKLSEKSEFPWIYVREVHVLPDFAQFVTEKIKELSVVGLDQNDKFRLIMSCNPCRLPRVVLTHSIRVTMQPNKLMKRKVARDIAMFHQQEVAAITVPANKEKFTPQYRRLMLSLSILHVMLEKRNVFGKKAWSVPYVVGQEGVDMAGKLILYALDSFKEQQQLSSSSAAVPAATRPQQAMPWDALRKVIEEVCLGGRLSEEYDSRTLGCLIEMYINDDVTNGNYAFRESSTYRIPAQSTFSELLKFVETLPDTDDYEICNMAGDVTLEGQRSEMATVLKQMQAVDPRKNLAQLTGLAKSSEMEKVDAAVAKITEEMPELGLTKEDVNPAVTEAKKGLLYGHHMFLLQEMARYNSLIKTIQDSMARIKLFLQNGELMPESLEKIYFALAEGRVPEEFTGYRWNHPLGEWVLTLKKRIEYIRDWLKAGEVKGYWLRALIYPKGLLNALLLYFAQKTNHSVETLSFVQEFTAFRDVSDIVDPQPQTGYIYDLYMTNARYNPDNGVLEEFTNEEQRKFSGPFKYSRLPVIAITPTDQPKEERGDYVCPVYYLPTKVNAVGSLQNLVTKVDCPTDLKSQYWILKDVFITCIDPELNTQEEIRCIHSHYSIEVTLPYANNKHSV